MRTLHNVLPMAGYGSRFAKEGITTPKPLIPVDRQPMFKKALSSLDVIDAQKEHTVILREEHDREHDLGNRIKAELPGANVVTTNEPATGALVDAYRARPHIQKDQGIFIMDCDIELRSDEYFDKIRQSLMGKLAIDGALMLFESDNPRYSYAQLDDEGIVVATAEKKVISPYAIAGGYYVSTPEVFDEAAQAVFDKPLDDEHPEYYVSYMYNSIVALGGKVLGITGDFTSFGTPQELAAYEAREQ